MEDEKNYLSLVEIRRGDFYRGKLTNIFYDNFFIDLKLLRARKYIGP